MGYGRLSAIPLEAPVITSVTIALGILAWTLVAIVLSLLLARAIRLNRPQVLDVAPPEVRPASESAPDDDPTIEVLAGFPAEPARFVGRTEAMVAASAALAPATGHTAVVLHGMAGTGKTTCAVKLAYQHQGAFRAMAFWSAPSDPDQVGDAMRRLALALESQLADHGFTMVEEIASWERWERFLSALAASFADAGLLLVLDNLDPLLTPAGQWRDLRWASLMSALTSQPGASRLIVTSRVVPAGLDRDTVLIRAVHALSRDETLMLVGELPELRVLLRSV